MKHIVSVGVLIVLLGSFTVLESAEARGFGSGRMIRQNSSGGVTAVGGRAIHGANGGAAGAHAIRGDGSGNVVGGSAQVISTPGGVKGARAGGFQRNADGSFTHKSGGAIQGSQGSASSSGSFTKNADGTASGSRSTTAQSTSGASYQGSTTYSSESGVDHSGTCYNANGEPVSCQK